MDILGSLFGTAKVLPGRFQFADGNTISAREYGFQSASAFVVDPATALFETCFKSEELGPKFPITELAIALPGIPHLYFITFHTAMYIAYAKEVAGADESTLADIDVGIANAVSEYRMPDKLPLSAGARTSLLATIANLSQAICVDLSEAFAPASGDTDHHHAKHATKMLLSLVEQSFHEAGTEPVPPLSGITSAHAQRLWLLDNAPFEVLLFLQKEQKVKFLPSH